MQPHLYVSRRPVTQPGCSKCQKPGCRLCPVVHEGEAIASLATGFRHRIRQRLTCQSKDVVYIITCLRCCKQGVGETKDPSDRCLSYVNVAQYRRGTEAEKSCSIHKHFLEAPSVDPTRPHTLQDLAISFVESVPNSKLGRNLLYKNAIRKRLESSWIMRLQARLNSHCQQWQLFSGHDGARGPPTRNDSV